MNEAFTMLKDRAANSIALNIPDFSKKFVLVTDASNEASGAMLANREGNQMIGQLKPIAFFHHTLTSEERRYSTTDKELLAVVLAIKKFRVYFCKPFDLIRLQIIKHYCGYKDWTWQMNEDDADNS